MCGTELAFQQCSRYPVTHFRQQKSATSGRIRGLLECIYSQEYLIAIYILHVFDTWKFNIYLKHPTNLCRKNISANSLSITLDAYYLEHPNPTKTKTNYKAGLFNVSLPSKPVNSVFHDL